MGSSTVEGRYASSSAGCLLTSEGDDSSTLPGLARPSFSMCRGFLSTGTPSHAQAKLTQDQGMHGKGGASSASRPLCCLPPLTVPGLLQGLGCPSPLVSRTPPVVWSLSCCAMRPSGRCGPLGGDGVVRRDPNRWSSRGAAGGASLSRSLERENDGAVATKNHPPHPKLSSGRLSPHSVNTPMHHQVPSAARKSGGADSASLPPEG